MGLALWAFRLGAGQRLRQPDDLRDCLGAAPAVTLLWPPLLLPEHRRSGFSRRADHATFTRLALVETHRRGVATAGRVAGVADGAGWAQGFLDDHRPDAVRILDWCHAAQYLVAVATACFAAGEAASHWRDAQRRELLEGEPAVVLGKLRGLRDERAAQAGAAASAKLVVVETSLHYLEERRAQLRYADFTAAGLPIGSGVIESANKLVGEVRLKGAGRRWAPAHVDPLLALRNVVCNDRWDEAWPRIGARLRQQAKTQVAARRATRRATTAVVEACPAAVAPPPARPQPALPPPRHPRARALRRTTIRGAATASPSPRRGSRRREPR